jgi:hypothetical protein
MKKLLLATTFTCLAAASTAQDAKITHTCLITFYGNPLAEGPCTMTVSEEEGLVQITGKVPDTDESYNLVASETTNTATLTGGSTFILAAGAQETNITNGGATINWPNGYALNATAVME